MECTRSASGTRRGYGLAFFAVAGVGLCLSGWGCGGMPEQATVDLTATGSQGGSMPSRPQELTKTGLVVEYYLEVGDLIRVDFFYAPELTTDLVVRPDGRVTVPGVGDMMAAGRTPRAVAHQIRAEFEDILVNPQVTVIVKEVAIPKVYVIGLVEKPGPVDFIPSISAWTAISAAGGPTLQGKLASVVVLRRVSRDRVSATRLDLARVLSGEDPSGDMYLEPYDIVYVPKRFVSHLRDFALDFVRTVVPATNLYMRGWYD